MRPRKPSKFLPLTTTASSVTSAFAIGIFAAILGTYGLLSPEDQARIPMFAVNRFRGDMSLFTDGVRILEERSGKHCLGVFPFDTEDEAVALANDVRYGLGASVWSADTSRVLRLTRRLDFGDIWVNTHYVRQSETPFGGWKESGVGRELGLAGLREYLAYKRICLDSSPGFHLKEWWEAGS